MNKSRRLSWAGHVARTEEIRSALKILTDKPTGNRPVGRPRRIRGGRNVGMNLKEISIYTRDWGDSAQDRD